MKPSSYKADALLLLAAIIWGGGFVAQRMGMAHIGPLAYNAIRFALGAAVLVPLIVYRRRRAAGASAPAPPGNALRAGLIAGSILFVAASLQQFGLVHTTAGKAGFITGLYVVLVPILGLTIGQRTRLAAWLGAGLAAAGLFLLSVKADFAINRGDVYVMLCAIGWAIHVLAIARLAPQTDPIELAAVQFTLTAVLSGVLALARETTTLADVHAATGAILYGGVCSVGIAYTLQVVGQRHAPPTHAAILLSGEAVFAALGGALLLGESLALRELLGCGLMFMGIVTSQLRRPRGAPRATE
jgi:drug/metabolite transporter (DMT)-like permease